MNKYGHFSKAEQNYKEKVLPRLESKHKCASKKIFNKDGAIYYAQKMEKEFGFRYRHYKCLVCNNWHISKVKERI